MKLDEPENFNTKWIIDAIMALSFPPFTKSSHVLLRILFDENLTYNLVLLQSDIKIET